LLVAALDSSGRQIELLQERGELRSALRVIDDYGEKPIFSVPPLDADGFR